MSSSTGTNDENAKEETTHTTRDFNKNKENDRESSLGLGTKSWRSLIDVSIARSRKIRGSNYVQLATVTTGTGEPRCRTVVFRGFQNLPRDHPLTASSYCNDLSCIMKMCTDKRSQKVQQEQLSAELVWWFPKSNEQYRVRGTLLYVGGGGDFPQHDDDDDDAVLQAARKELWGNLSDAARESFLETAVPGAPITEKHCDGAAKNIPNGGRDPETGKPVPPPDNFLLLLLFPHYVDYLNLKENYRQIDEASSDESIESKKKVWSFQQVNA